MKSDPSLSFEQLKQINTQLDQQLADLSSNGSLRKAWSWKMFFLRLLLFLIGLVLPFLILVRVSVLVYQHYQLNGWIALVVGCLATILLLSVYAGLFIYRYGLGRKTSRYIIKGMMVLVFAYSGYGMLYYSSLNTKTEKVHSYYRSLHPIVRVALTTVTLADTRMVITDIQRSPKDYQKMGLPENSESLHYVQNSGYVHAVDLRTIGRAEWKNRLMEYTFNMLGISSIRHVGTADHLHIYLPKNR